LRFSNQRIDSSPHWTLQSQSGHRVLPNWSQAASREGRHQINGRLILAPMPPTPAPESRVPSPESPTPSPESQTSSTLPLRLPHSLIHNDRVAYPL
jgi:hypothetical protein